MTEEVAAVVAEATATPVVETATISSEVAPVETAAPADEAAASSSVEPSILDSLAPAPVDAEAPAVVATEGGSAVEGDDAPDETPVEAAAAPEAITFDAFVPPEGLTYNAEAAAPFLNVLSDAAKEYGLTKDQAQKLGQDLVALHGEALLKQINAIRETAQADAQKQIETITADVRNEAHTELQKIADQRKSWADASIEEFGKQRDTVISAAKSGANAFLDGTAGDGELTEFYNMLRETGAGNHPLMIRYLSRVGQAVAKQATLAPGSAQAAKPDALTAMYGPKSK